MDILPFFLTENGLVPPLEQEKLLDTLKPLTKKLEQIHQAGVLDVPESSINLPTDSQNLQCVTQLFEEKKALAPSLMVVVGIGGSNLGTQAIYEALFGKQGSSRAPLYFADTVDSDYIYHLGQIVQEALTKSHKVLITLISKSGSTTESIANFEYFLTLLKKYHPQDYHNYIIAITNDGSPLWQFAGQQRWSRLAIPECVGGRYSVLSAVGLFPLLFTGANIQELLNGAATMVQACTSTEWQKNPAALSATAIAYYYNNGIAIHDLFIFSVALESLGKWYRQLMGESIGKQQIVDKKVPVGITPTVSIGSTDLHSVGQLYLGGPLARFTTFITVEKNNHAIILTTLPEYEKLVAGIQGKSLSSIMGAISTGTMEAYAQNKLPFMLIMLPQKNEYYLGQFFQFKMIEIMYLGALLQVNPFDQPQVELYKAKTRNILAHE